MTARGSPIAVVLVLIVILGAAVFSWSLTVRAPPPAPTMVAASEGGIPLTTQRTDVSVPLPQAAQVALQLTALGELLAEEVAGRVVAVNQDAAHQ